jgi:hypothetical protein
MKRWKWWAWVVGRLRKSRRRQLEEWMSGLRETNRLLVKAGLRDKARIGELEKDVAVLNRERSGELPGLTPGEIERLAILAEECGEVMRAVGKVLRYGWESRSPYGGRPNRTALEREIGSVRAIVNLMLDSDDLSLAELQAWQRLKRAGLAKWTLYQECSMPREEQLAMMAAIEDNREQ